MNAASVAIGIVVILTGWRWRGQAASTIEADSSSPQGAWSIIFGMSAVLDLIAAQHAK
jgi:hypothetical protein